MDGRLAAYLVGFGLGTLFGLLVGFQIGYAVFFRR